MARTGSVPVRPHMVLFNRSRSHALPAPTPPSPPRSGDPHASTGNTPGLCVIKVSKSGRSGRIESIRRISNVDAAGVERAVPHALGVRDLSPRWGG